MPNADEVVYVAQGNRQLDWTQELSAAGFVVMRRPGEQLAAELGIEGGPSSIIEDPTGNVRYRGGYQRSRPHEEPEAAQVDPRDRPQDTLILTELMKGQNVAAFPAFGCAASSLVQAP